MPVYRATVITKGKTITGLHWYESYDIDQVFRGFRSRCRKKFGMDVKVDIVMIHMLTEEYRLWFIEYRKKNPYRAPEFNSGMLDFDYLEPYDPGEPSEKRKRE